MSEWRRRRCQRRPGWESSDRRRVPGRRDARSRRDGVRATPGADRRRRRGIKGGAVSDSGAEPVRVVASPTARPSRARARRTRGRRGGDAAAGAPDQGPRIAARADEGVVGLILDLPARFAFPAYDALAASVLRHIVEDPHTLQLAMDEIHAVLSAADRRARSRGPIPARRSAGAPAAVLRRVARVSARPRVFPRGAREVRAHGALAGPGRRTIVLKSAAELKEAKDREREREGAPSGSSRPKGPAKPPGPMPSVIQAPSPARRTLPKRSARRPPTRAGVRDDTDDAARTARVGEGGGEGAEKGVNTPKKKKRWSPRPPSRRCARRWRAPVDGLHARVQRRRGQIRHAAVCSARPERDEAGGGSAPARALLAARRGFRAGWKFRARREERRGRARASTAAGTGASARRFPAGHVRALAGGAPPRARGGCQALARAERNKAYRDGTKPSRPRRRAPSWRLSPRS